MHPCKVELLICKDFFLHNIMLHHNIVTLLQLYIYIFFFFLHVMWQIADIRGPWNVKLLKYYLKF